jgi:hypothetical protein
VSCGRSSLSDKLHIKRDFSETEMESTKMAKKLTESSLKEISEDWIVERMNI